MPFKRPACLSSPDYEDERGERRRRSGAGKNDDVTHQVALRDHEHDEIPEEERGSCSVELVKREGEILGLTVSGGADREGRPKISNLRPSAIAAKSDLVQTGDHIISVNGIKTSKLKHGEIISLLKNIGEIVKLEIEYQLPPTTVTTSKIVQKTCDVTLRRDPNWGFVLRGGRHPTRHCLSRPLVVTQVREGSGAEREGSLKTGDRIVALDSIPLHNLTLEEALLKLRHVPVDDVTFTIEYDVSVMDSVSKSSGALMVEVYKAPREELGISLTKSSRGGKSAVVIDRVKPASIADRCGALHVGDQILSIDAVSMTQQSVNLREASELLQSSSDQLRIEILPFSRFAIANKPFSAERFAPSISSARSLATFPSSSRFHHQMTLASDKSSTRGWARSNSSTVQRRHLGTARNLSVGGASGQQSHYRSAMSLAFNHESRPAQVTHTEQHHVRLFTRDDHVMGSSSVIAGGGGEMNFGIELFASVFTTEVLGSPPVIASLEPDRPADLCGVVHAGDRILSVNGFLCEEFTVDDVNQLLAQAYQNGQVDLEMEFDVGESVVASSGIFHAKLPARRGVNIGIELSSGSSDPASPIVISKIVTGSQAHRSGTLSVGDQILAIDGFRWLTNGNGMTVDYARTLLGNADDIVRLKIQKRDEGASDEDSDEVVTYTVELKRHAGSPLGITISGTEDPYDPIVISQLTPGSLAARTGAIHEEDEILSINSTSLKFLTLSEAIRILQNADEIVTFKIKRALKPTSPPDDVREKPEADNEGASYLMRRSSFADDDDEAPPHESSEPSDPEDDILPPRMTCLMTSQPQPAEVGEYWEGNNKVDEPHQKQKQDDVVDDDDEKVDKLLESLRIDNHDDVIPPQPPSMTSPPPSSGEIPSHNPNPSNQERNPTTTTTTGGRSRSRTRRNHNNRNQGQQDNNNLTSQQQQMFNNNTTTTTSCSNNNNQKLETSSTRTWAGRNHRSARCQSEKRNQQQQQQQKQPLPLADWQRALDDLQSVGQSSQYLADLENNLTCDDTSLMTSSSSTHHHNPHHHHHLQQDTIGRRGGGGGYLHMPQGVRDVRSRGLRRHGSNPTSSSNNSVAPTSGFLPLKFHKIIITKSQMNEDFGFSLSDGQTEPGVYVHTIRPNSPACRAGLLPYDRILQVNGSSVSDSNSRVVIYVITSNVTSQNLILFVSRYGSGGSSYITTSTSSSPHQRQKILLSPPVSPNQPLHNTSAIL